MTTEKIKILDWDENIQKNLADTIHESVEVDACENCGQKIQHEVFYLYRFGDIVDQVQEFEFVNFCSERCRDNWKKENENDN